MPGETPNQPASPAPAAPAATVLAAAAPASAAPVATPPAAAAPAQSILQVTPPAEKPAASPAPDAYQFKAPQGQELDPLQIETYSPVFKELGLTQDQAQKLIDASFVAAPKLIEAHEKQIQDALAKQSTDWGTASKSDKEFGGVNFDANAKIANQALSQFGTKELNQLLVEEGLGNHPEVVRLFWKIGTKLQEGKPPTNTTVTNASSNPASVLYPSMKTN